jgi:hypothetical protein
MSINSLLTNPKILNELIIYVESQLPTTGITTLNNTDGNCVLTKIGTVGQINLSDNIDLASGNINVNEIITALITNDTVCNIFSSDSVTYSKLYVDPEGIFIYSNSDQYYIAYLNNGEFALSGNVKLLLNNNKNIFSTDGTNGQVLQTDGNNNLSWVTSIQTNETYIKNLYTNYAQLPNQPLAYTITIFNATVNGFTVGKTAIYDFSFTFTPSNVGGGLTILLNVNGSTQSALTYVNNDELGLTVHRSVSFEVVSTVTNPLISITVINTEIVQSVQLETFDYDYFTLCINEIQ